jgi:hypothetical protein
MKFSRKSKNITPVSGQPASKNIIHIDVKAGELTFGQRIELGKLFQAGLSPSATFEKVFEVLHQITPKSSSYAKLMPYFEKIINGLMFWFEQEKLLDYKPTSEEIQAGIRELSEVIGEFGTVKALAKAYGRDPDEILQWQYGKIFGILFTDMKEAEYQKRYEKIIERKYKKFSK